MSSGGASDGRRGWSWPCFGVCVPVEVGVRSRGRGSSLP